MFVVGNLVEAIALMRTTSISALLSWVRPDPSNPIVMFLERVSDLVCNPIRRVIPTNVSGIDFAPFIAMLAIWFVRMFLVKTLHDAAVRMG